MVAGILRYAAYFLTVSLPLLLVGCELTSLMVQQTAQSMGGECVETDTSGSLYDTSSGDYQLGYMAVRNAQGQDVEVSETNWLRSRQRAYSNTLGASFATSPYSGASYKFVTDCVAWADNSSNGYY
jgi:hypothetical protein